MAMLAGNPRVARGVQAFALLIAALALAACLGDTTFLQPGKTTTDTTGTGGTHDTTAGVVQRAQLVIVVAVHGQDSALAAQLGGRPGVLPHAAVTVQRQGSATRLTDTTDANGRVVFSGLTAGPVVQYAVSAARLLASAETAVFDSTDRDVNAFGGGTSVNGLAAPADSLVVTAAAGRRGSLVFSEIYDGVPNVNGVGYDYAGFLEVLNNSDTTIYLDGKVLGTGPLSFLRASTLPGFYTCAETSPWRLDPDGIWSPFLWQFPGTGRDHALAPGATAVIAMDAVNHSVVAPGLPDLSTADFEFIGSKDADNPAVPNMINATPLEWLSIVGHGFSAGFYYDFMLFLADTLDVNALPAVRPSIKDPNVAIHYRVPRAKVLDVFTSFLTPQYERNEATFPPCPDAVLPIYDRQPGALLEGAFGGTSTITRLVLGTLPDGRAILQRTGATVNDFVLGAMPTPGYIR